MLKSTVARHVSLAAIIGVTLSNPAFAQSEAAGDEAMGDIVVTARRVEERLQEVPISITVFTQENISNRNIVNSADLGTYTPSLSTNSRYGSEKASFAIRGFQQDLQTQPSVGVYFADVAAPRSGGSTTGGNGVGVGNMFDLQSVQVLKGPQGTLFGRNTTGGAVLLVPKKPTGILSGYVEGSLGDYDLRRLQAVVNVPLADAFKVRLGIDRMKRDGYLNNHSGVGPSKLANVNYTAARLSIVADLSPDLENYTVATYSRSENHGIALRLVGVNSIPPAPASQAANIALAKAQFDRQNSRDDGWWDVENSKPNPRLLTETWQAINTTTWMASDTLTVKNIASYSEYRELAGISINGDNFISPSGGPTLQITGIGNTPGYDMSSQSTFTEELQLQSGSSDGRLRWQAGGYYEASNPLGVTSQTTVVGLRCSDVATYQCAAAPAINFGPGVGPVFISTLSQPFQKTRYRSTGVYAQATYDVTEQLSLTGGIRYTWDKMSQNYAATAIGFPAANTPVAFCNNTVRVRNADGTFPVLLPGPGLDYERCGVSFSTKSQKPTWLIDVDYKPVDDILLYAKWARGYRGGGVASANIYFESWGPEKVDSYELGAKTSFRNSFARGYFNVAGFYNDFTDQQIQQSLVRAPTSPLLGGFAIVNAGKSRIWGVELDGAVTVLDLLKIDGGYTYLNTKLLSLTPVDLTADQQLIWAAVVPTAVPGGPLALSPKNRFTLTGTFLLPLDEQLGKISLSATWVHTSSQTASRATDPKFGILPATNLVNLNANWSGVLGAPVDLAFFITNVANTKFPVNVAGAWRSYGFEAQNVNEPRMWGLRLKYLFGE